ncbi:MAG TPA: 4-(cytidine 5'-diphospho)-2-C-methyl-D-erythritol kinase [Acidimicrobiales bacterium]|nr:4-(cytidine 5'-diphospho)-2-C-methyl-D-erythritol kinase [Acidimicrobiales bacterium]
MPDVLRAHAKLTLSLRVTGVRDDRYHLLDAEMVSLDLADTLEFSAGDGLEMELDTGGFAGTVPSGSIPLDDENLVRRALKVLGRRAHVRLHKRIPAGAGLGGGSADAAAVLRWAGVVDLDLAATLGADVPFCLVGGRARVTGVGETVEPLDVDLIAGRAYTLLTPPLHVSTVEVYRQWDRMGGPTGDNGNDLEPAALAAYPDLAVWRNRLGDDTGETPMLAGSGGTWFVEGDFPESGRVVRVCRPS